MRARLAALIATTALAGGPATAQPGAGAPPEASASPAPVRTDAIATYFDALAAAKLVDVESGTLETLRRELAIGEGLLTDGAFTNAAVALYTIVKTPRHAAFTDFVEYQNAEYDLGVALARAGSYGASLDALEAVLARGPGAPYWGPAHRRAVDIALETRDHAGVLARIEAVTLTEPVPVSAAGERAYLRGRAAYDAGKLAAAEGELVGISKNSRLYSSAIYLRGVIKARRGEYRGSAEAMCEVAGTPDSDKFTFVVDGRYFTIKDLARLGLGRLAHESGAYDDAYYHYFQIPDDSTYLPDALFEAAWSMYQKRELATARDLVREFLREFPSSPMWPEASLLAGYVELADCKFADSQQWYDKLVVRLQPIVDTMDQIRTDADLRRQLFTTAVTRAREVKASEQLLLRVAPRTPVEDVLALLRLDAKFLRLHGAMTGMRELAGSAPAVVRQWQNLGAQVAETKVAAVSTERTLAEEQLTDANAVLGDVRRLVQQVRTQRAELARARREGTLPADVADAERTRLGEVEGRVERALAAATQTAEAASAAVTTQAAAGLRPLLTADLGEARRLDRMTQALLTRLDAAGDVLAQRAIERLYAGTRRVLDKAKLGKIDAVIGQKRKLDIEVQDLAAGRFPEELIGKLWNASMIGDDEEYWPWEGEYWADEYKGWR